MPSTEQFVAILRASEKGLPIPEIADAAGFSIHTINRVLQLQREYRDGVDLRGGATKTGWKMLSVNNGLSALESLHAEKDEFSARPGIVKQVAAELSELLGVPITRDVLGPKSDVWIGHGLFGSLAQEPQLHIEGKNEWRIFDEDMPVKMRGSLTIFRQSLGKYGRSIKAMHRVCLSNLPVGLGDPSIVRNPDLAREAAVVSMLFWLTQPQKKGATYSVVARRDYLPKSKDTTTIELGAWAIETRITEATEALFIDLLECSEIILESREAETFKKSYRDAQDATKALLSDLFDLAVS